MAGNNLTIFQRLNNAFRSTSRSAQSSPIVSMSQTATNRVLFTTNDKAAYEKKLSSLKQEKYLAYQWRRASMDNALESLNGYTAVKLMYRDVDLMDGTPEIGTALDIISEEVCPLNSKGKMINISSKSPRVKSILEDLFVNRLHIYTELPMIARHTCKYGNTFNLLNISKDNGVMGWMMMPVYEMDRIENGYGASYSVDLPKNANDLSPDEIKFMWRGQGGDQVFRNWQIAHFRLLEDSFFLPYGVSMLHKARRAWRMWSMMEDAMLIWRLDKAIERRIFKIYVGAIDDNDVPAYIDEIADRFKRTAIIDPATGQIDLRKNFLDISSDYFIPVRREDAPTPIETLAAANSQVQMEDIEYMQNKVFSALRVPKTFLNFKEAQGKAQNLSYMDIRFARMVNRIQQFILMELNKIAMIHLYLLGLQDEIGNFQISLNNPTSQIEAQEIEDLQKRVTILQAVLADPGNGIPIMSLHKGLKEILKMTDSEIKDMLNEIRLEKAISAELANTTAIIKETGIFKSTDRIYGDYDAMNSNQPVANQQQDENGGLGGGGGMGGGLAGGGDIGGDLGDENMMGNLGEPGGDTEGDIGGEMGETDMGGAPDLDNGSPLMENNKKPIIKENTHNIKKSFIQQYLDMLTENENIENGYTEEPYDYDTRNATMEHQINVVCNKIDELVTMDNKERTKLIEAAANEINKDKAIVSGVSQIVEQSKKYKKGLGKKTK